MSWFNWGKPKYDVHVDLGGDLHFSARLVERGTAKPMLVTPVNARFRNPQNAINDLRDRMIALGLAGKFDRARHIVEKP